MKRIVIWMAHQHYTIPSESAGGAVCPNSWLDYGDVWDSCTLRPMATILSEYYS